MAAASIALVALLSGCWSTGGSTAPPSAALRQDVPSQAVGLLPVVWHVHDAAGADADTYLLFHDHGMDVLTPKGFVLLDWATQGDAILSTVGGWSETFGTKRPPTVPWLTEATRFRRDGPGWVLLDASGRRSAVLRDDGPAPRSSTTITTPDPVTSSATDAVADAVAGPGARTVPMASVLGRWSATGLDPEHASLTVHADGTWRVSGGCASGTGQDLGGAGRFRLLPGGSLLLTTSAIAGVGCLPPARTPPPDAAALTRFFEARSLAVEGGNMTVFDRAGKRIGTLTRQG